MHSAILPTHERFLPKKHGDKPDMSRKIQAILRSRGVTKFRYPICLLISLLLFMIFHSGGSSRQVSDSAGVHFYDLSKQTASQGHYDAKKHQERILVCIPLRNAEPVMELMFDHLYNFTYPHELMDLAFLVGDSTDDTDEILLKHADSMEKWPKTKQYGNIDIYRRDFGAVIGQGVDDRHGVAVQGVRRKLMGRARNWLLSAALRPHHSWVYWRDADIETAPADILEFMMEFGRDVIVPNVWRPLPKFLGGAQPYDLNSWVESPAALELATKLEEDDVIVEGYAEYPTYRVHLAYLRADKGNGNQRELMDLDGIGGVSILSKAKVFRAGTIFPGFAFENHAETEGFGKMARKNGYSVGGLTQYTVWHKYEPSVDDLKEMERLKAAGLPYD